MASFRKISVRTFALGGLLSFLILQLNFYFAWTSHVGAAISSPLGYLSTSGGGAVRSFLVNEVDDFVRMQFGIPGLSSFFASLASKGAYNGGGGRFGGGGGGPFGGGGFYGGGGFNGGGSPGGNGFLFLGPSNSLAMKYFIDSEVILFTIAIFLISVFLFLKSGVGVALLRGFEITSLAILPLGIEIFFYDRFEFNVHASDIEVLAGVPWLTNADVLALASTILGAALFVEVVRRASRKGDNRPAGQLAVEYSSA